MYQLLLALSGASDEEQSDLEPITGSEEEKSVETLDHVFAVATAAATTSDATQQQQTSATSATGIDSSGSSAAGASDPW
jgi:hypothetical protein